MDQDRVNKIKAAIADMAEDRMNQLAQCCWVGLKMMIKQMVGRKKLRNEYAPETIDKEADGQAPANNHASKTHVLILALDYPGTGHELTCTKDANNLVKLLQACGISDVTKLYNSDAHLANVKAKLRSTGGACRPGDYYVIYYSGHGVTVPDTSGDEEDGMDEAFALVTPAGQIDHKAFLIDDDFAEIVCSSTPDGVNIIVITDCCHSGTIADFNQPCWGKKMALSMSGCTDSQTSGDTGRGGIFTHSLLMAIENMQKRGISNYSVGKIYNRTLYYDNSVFNSEQEISLGWSPSCGPTHMAWPLVPTAQYQAPWTTR